jgi:hypothetical protein
MLSTWSENCYINYMCYNKYLCAISVFTLTAVNLLASFSVNEDWSTYVGGNNDFHGVKASAMGSSGSVYIGGYSYGGVIAPDGGFFSPVESSSSAGEEGFIAKIDASGVMQWYSVVGSTENDEVRGVAEYDQSVFAAACLERTATYDDGTDAYMYSFSKSSGSFNWNSPLVIGAIDATNAFNAVTVDTNGNIYAVGYTSIDGLTFSVSGYQVDGTTYGNSLQGDLDACVVKVSPTGSLIWVHYLGGANFDSALTCTIGTNGYLYVGGETYSPDWVTETNDVNPSASHKAGFLVKLSTAGDHVWSTFLGGSEDDTIAGVAFDNISGNLFAVGTTGSSGFMSSNTQLNSYGGGSSDGFVTSITDSGSTLTVNWSQFYGSNQNDTVTSIQQLDDSQLVVGGSTPVGGWLPDADNVPAGGNDGFVAAFGSNGDSLWGHYVGGSDSEELYTLAAEGGILYAGGTTLSEDDWVSGSFRGSWDHDWNFGLTSLGFLVKYVSSGYIPDLPVIITQPQSISVEEEQEALFSIEAESAEPLSYQWSVNNVPVADATNTSFTLSAVTLAQDGDEISCAVSNIAGSVFSETAVLTVTPIPMGWITIDLSPAGAVSNGVAWSIDSGSTWHDSGDVINVITGDYAIVYRDDVFGWAAPSTPDSTTVMNLETNSLAATFTEIIYSSVRSITGTNVLITINPPDGTGFWMFTEKVPVGLTVLNLSHGTWESSSGEITHTTGGAQQTLLSYEVAGGVGVYQVTGSVQFVISGVVTETTVGDDEIVIGGAPVVVPDPDIIGFVPDGTVPGNFQLTFISIVDQSYLIETNGTPAVIGWAQQGQVNGDAEQTTTSVGAPNETLFYRVSTPTE